MKAATVFSNESEYVPGAACGKFLLVNISTNSRRPRTLILSCGLKNESPVQCLQSRQANAFLVEEGSNFLDGSLLG
jgi:hypothetical protein